LDGTHRVAATTQGRHGEERTQGRGEAEREPHFFFLVGLSVAGLSAGVAGASPVAGAGASGLGDFPGSGGSAGGMSGARRAGAGPSALGDSPGSGGSVEGMSGSPGPGTGGVPPWSGSPPGSGGSTMGPMGVVRMAGRPAPVPGAGGSVG